MEILYRINPISISSKATLKDIKDEFPITGYFGIDFEGNFYGYYHNNPLGEGEEGLFSISNWFTALAQCYEALKTYDFVALNDVETMGSWILFEKLNNEMLCVSIIKSPKKIGAGLIVTEYFEFEYGEWRNIPIKAEVFANEFIGKSQQFIDDLLTIDKRFLEIVQIKQLLKIINNKI